MVLSCHDQLSKSLRQTPQQINVSYHVLFQSLFKNRTSCSSSSNVLHVKKIFKIPTYKLVLMFRALSVFMLKTYGINEGIILGMGSANGKRCCNVSRWLNHTKNGHRHAIIFDKIRSTGGFKEWYRLRTEQIRHRWPDDIFNQINLAKMSLESTRYGIIDNRLR